MQFVIILFYIKWQIMLTTQSDRDLAHNVGDEMGGGSLKENEGSFMPHKVKDCFIL